MVHHQPADVAPVPVTGVAVDRLWAGVVVAGVPEGRVLTLLDRARRRLVPVVAPAGEGARGLVDVVLRVHVGVRPEAVGERLQVRVVAQAEQLHHLAPVVLVGLPLVRVGAVQPQQHGRVDRDLLEQVVEVPDRVPAQQPVLAQHVPGVADAGVGGREQVVQVQRHPLHQLVSAAHHAVEPPQAVVAPQVERLQPVAAVGRDRPDQHVLAKRRQQLGHGLRQPQLHVVRDLVVAARETGAPQQSLEVRARRFGRQGRIAVRHGAPSLLENRDPGLVSTPTAAASPPDRGDRP